MKKIRLLVVVLAAILAVVLTTATAQAKPLFTKIDKTVVSPDGKVQIDYYKSGFVISEAKEGAVWAQATARPKTMSAAASGGYSTPSYTGSRQVTITSSYYLLGDLVSRYVTPFSENWSAGKVTYFRNLASSYPHPSLFYFLATERVGTPDYNPSGTQVYSWKSATIEFRVTKWGVLAEMYPTHEIWANGNGTYTWHAHP
jgi:hypothetical protein